MSEQFPTTAELIAKHQLRDRIAAVIDAHTYGTNKRAYEVADAVIAALGLSEQTHCDECANHRYVTEWENDV